ncbi:unnamed protein product, partial [Mesorhabditis spiculigera]
MGWMLLWIIPIVFAAGPEQIHLALTGDQSEMNVGWVTMGTGSPTYVSYGLSATSLTSKSENSNPKSWTYAGITRVSHNVVLKGLKENTHYFYQISGSSKTYAFKTLPMDGLGVRICLFGDLGLTGVNFQGEGQSIESLLAAAAANKFDMVVHIGDIAYDLHSDNGTVGDGYMNKMEPLMATMPYMVIAGNHEDDNENFTNYKMRFHMPKNGADDGTFYSFDLGPVHFVGINTENYGYYYKYGTDSIYTQYDWLQKDLEMVDRSKTPWLISYQHRPFYCSNDNSGDCSAFENQIVRTGFMDMPGLEPLFLKYGMDMGFWGHEHSYERFYPIANKVYYNDKDPYNNPDAPVYIVTGSAGCHSGYADFTNPPLPFSAKQVNDYGYSIMTIKDRSTMYLEQISIEKKDAVVDSVAVIKDVKETNRIKIRRRGHVLPRSNRRSPKCHPKDSRCWARSLKKSNTEL